MIGGSDRFWIAFDKNVQTQHMIVRCHGTLDRHGQGYRIARLRNLGEAQGHAARLRLTRANAVAHSLLYHILRGPGTSRPEGHQDASSTELSQQGAPAELQLVREGHDTVLEPSRVSTS